MEGQRPRHQQRVGVFVLALVLAFGVVLLSSPAVGPAYADRCWFNPSGEYVCEGDPSDPGDPGDPGGPGNPGRQPHDVYYTPACMANGPPPNDPNAMCMNATMACQVNGEEGEIMMRIYYQWEENGPWELQDTRCVGGDEQPVPVITPDQVRGWLENGWLPTAAVAVNPGNGRTLINFPTIFYAGGATTYDQTHQVPGGSVRVEARATNFAWTWGDGASDSTSTPGVAYSRGTPKDSYVTHNYVDLGQYTVGVAVTWTADFWINGAAQPPLTITLNGTPSEPVTVLEKEQFLGRR
ncbi:hypothetical protein [Tenggerimyces flavus]|uniref:PKD domain-containing protein n=1 Tax=Tenggerimyces flavus TaxID=1708749 RepID=A0ABV7YC12_9ACTN|nr:hypothetical protein [Tenggerimyces flavus]MBM7787191.1 hypothetical protein [Tenggerimyces flavus]